MNENKEKETQEQSSKSNQGTGAVKSSNLKTDAVKASGWKRWLGKKWVFPATYMAAAAIILALMWVIQDSGKTDLDTTDLALNPNEQNEQAVEDAVPVGAVLEEMQWPADRSELEVTMPFYDAGGTSEAKQSAILEQGNKFTPNMGVSLARKDQKAFDILAAMSGKVTRSENVPSIGHLVEITHDGGLVTIYYSLSDVKVAKGDEVKQGDVIAKAGRNELEKSQGVHLHFEVHKAGEPVNPETFIAQNTSKAKDGQNDQTKDADSAAEATE